MEFALRQFDLCKDGVCLVPEDRKRICQEIVLVLYRALMMVIEIPGDFFNLIDGFVR